MKLHLLMSALLALMLAACAPQAVSAPGERVAPTTALEDGYQLGVGDKVKVTVYNEPGLSGEFAVNDAGNLAFPLIGEVRAIGSTPEQVAGVIESKLANGYLREPKVSVEVAVYRPYYILGEVKAPGQYPFASGLTVVNAVATAQGFTPRAQKGVVFIRKFGEDTEKPYEMTPDLKVFPGDTIRFGERYF